MEILCAFLLAYLATMSIRAVMSWFPAPHNSILVALQRAVVDVTEPVLAPVRRFMPQAGPIDLSYLVVMFVLALIVQPICDAV